jgi:hypothetical protein
MHHWNEAYMIMMNDHFDVLLDLVCENFIEYFCIDIHKHNCSEVLFFFGCLCGSGIRVIVTSYNELGCVPSVFVLWNSLRSVGITLL